MPPASPPTPSVPRIVGRNAGDIVTAMRGVPQRRAGRRRVMDRIAKGFADAEIEAIAAWFAAQQK